MEKELKRQIYLKAFNFVYDDVCSAGIDPDVLDFEINQDDISHIELSEKSKAYYSFTDPIHIVTVKISSRELTPKQEAWLENYGAEWHLLNESHSPWDVLRSHFVSNDGLNEYLEESYDEVTATDFVPEEY